MKDVSNYLDIGKLTALAKEACSINKQNSEMTDDEIRAVVRWIGKHAPDTAWVDGRLVFGRVGIDLMLLVTVSEFAKFYEKYNLGQYN